MKKVIVLPDLQCPYQDKKTLKAVEKYMADHKWDYYILLGDFLDYYCISKYNEGKPGLVEGKTIMAELAEGRKVLDRHIDIIRGNNKDAELVYLEGNHEHRATDYAHKNPNMRGIIEPENALDLEAKGIKYIKSWSQGKSYKIGKAHFVHGNYTNQHHSKKMVEAYEENIFYGHVHDCNSFNKTSKATGRTKVGQALGCLCQYPKDTDYTKGWPNNWNQAFGVFYVHDNGLFNHYVVRINNNSFISPDGKYYV